MTTFLELKNKASLFIDDDAMVTYIGDFINQGVSEVAGGWPSMLDGIDNPVPNSLTPPLPNLFTISTIDTSITDAFVDMPADFHRGLQLAVSVGGYEIDISDSLIDFTETYPLLDKSGRISEVIEHGLKLYYQGIPATSEAVTLHYYRKPVDMTADADVPDGIPEHLQVSLLVNFTAWKAFEHLEDGMEGERPNTIRFKNAFLDAIKTLELFIPSYTRGLLLR